MKHCLSHFDNLIRITQDRFAIRPVTNVSIATDYTFAIRGGFVDFRLPVIGTYMRIQAFIVAVVR